VISIISSVKKYRQLAFAILYLIICFVPAVWSGFEGGWVKSIYQLPLINVFQILIYPILLIVLFVIGRTGSSLSTLEEPLGIVISVINVIFLIILPTSLDKQVKLGWPNGSVLSGDHVIMRFGYYLLYALTIIYMMLFLVQWRISRVKSNSNPPTEAKKSVEINTDEEDWRPW